MFFAALGALQHWVPLFYRDRREKSKKFQLEVRSYLNTCEQAQR